MPHRFETTRVTTVTRPADHVERQADTAVVDAAVMRRIGRRLPISIASMSGWSTASCSCGCRARTSTTRVQEFLSAMDWLPAPEAAAFPCGWRPSGAKNVRSIFCDASASLPRSYSEPAAHDGDTSTALRCSETRALPEAYRDAGAAPGGGLTGRRSRSARTTHASVRVNRIADETTARPAGTERHTMSDDYPWDRSGPPDADVERLERSRHTA